MHEYSQMPSAEESLKQLRAVLCRKIATQDGDARTLEDLHQRV